MRRSSVIALAVAFLGGLAAVRWLSPRETPLEPGVTSSGPPDAGSATPPSALGVRFDAVPAPEVGPVGRAEEIRTDPKPAPDERGRSPASRDRGVSRDPILLQLVVHHGGTLYLDGTHNGRIEEMVDHDLWNEGRPLEKLQRSEAHVRGAGAIPPGRSFEIRRVTWRARLLANEPHSRLSIVAGRTQIARISSRDHPNPRGEWVGSVVLDAGQEKQFQVSALLYEMVEVRVHGRLVDREPR